MQNKIHWLRVFSLVSLLFLGVVGSAGVGAATAAPAKVRMMLDWTPNTNHTGLFVAQAKGYFAEANLDVEILPPGDTLVEQIVGIGTVDFGISYSESFSYSRASGLPVISVAAIIQHNTSGFAAIREQHPLKTPGDLNGLRYGAFGSPIEEPFLKTLITCAGANTPNVEVINVGYVDPLPLLERDRIDFVWLFYGWDGLRAEIAGLLLDVLMLKDYAQCVPDYYTPILITNETVIKDKPEVVRAFVGAVARGYAFAIENPAAVADILLKAAPDLDPALVKASAAWLATQYQADAPRWGEQQAEVWEKFVAFMVTNKVLETPFDVTDAFTNDFLPQP
jgi:ABC-type nitrate/sulfonate/bicarbonate transport system substrate-binding protein